MFDQSAQYSQISWILVQNFCDIPTLCSLSCVSKDLNVATKVTDYLWKEFCAKLWEDKQNHPLEQWVKLGVGLDFDSLWKTSSKSYGELMVDFLVQYSNSVGIDETILWLENALVASKQEMKMCEVPSTGNQIVFANMDSLDEYSQIYERVQVLNTYLLCATYQKSQGFEYFSFNYDTDTCKEPRLACSLSHHAIVKRIRQFEWPYVQVFREIDELEKRIFRSKDNSTEQIDALRSKLTICKERLRVCEEKFVEVYQTPIDLEFEERIARESGILLTWKQSYFASLIDSKRSCLTYEELREQGDYAIIFGNNLETCRFVLGGLGFLTNRVFKHKIGHVVLHDNHFSVPHVGAYGPIRRHPVDWGWEITINCVGNIRAVSFDRRNGWNYHKGFLSWLIPQAGELEVEENSLNSEGINGNRCIRQELLSPLAENIGFGLYPAV